MNISNGVFLAFLFTMAFSCHSGLREEAVVRQADTTTARRPDGPAEGSTHARADTQNFPLRSVQLAHDEADIILLLPFTSMIMSDSGNVYTVLGVYKGKKIGFKMRMPKGSSMGMVLVSMGEPSDNFLQFFQDVYRLERDKTSHFARIVKGACLFMGQVVDEAEDSSGKHGMIDGYKVFFDSDNPKLSSECYFNISLKDHWIELSEEPDYREKIVGALSRQ